MREVEFRVYFTFPDPDRDFMGIVKSMRYEDDAIHVVATDASGRTVGGRVRYSDPSNLMQYTGLRDCNDMKIFDRDIVVHRYEYGASGFIEERYIVLWNEQQAAFGYGKGLTDSWPTPKCQLPGDNHQSNFKVIGNIYTTPELIKGTNYVR